MKINSTYIVFVFLALLFWFLNALTKDYFYELSVPVNYKNLPVNTILVDPIDELYIGAEGPGSVFIISQLGLSRQTIEIDLEKYKNAKQIQSSLLLTEINSTIENLEVSSVRPNMVNIDLQSLLYERFKVKPAIINNLESQFEIKKLEIEPDSVWISAPKSIIDTLQYVLTEEFTISGGYEPYTATLNLKNVNNNSILSTTEAKIRINFSEFTEKQVETEIIVKGVENSDKILIYPSTTIVTFRVNVDDYDTVTGDMFEVTADFSGIKLDEIDKVELSIDKSPPNTREFVLSNQYIEFLLYQ